MMSGVWGVMAAWMVTRVTVESRWAGTLGWLWDRPELVTRAAGWKQLQEGLFLVQHGMDVSGDKGEIFPQSPLLLDLFSLLTSPLLVSCAFAAADCYCAWLVLQLRRNRRPQVAQKPAPMLSAGGQLEDWQLVSCYLFSPLNLVTTLSRSTIVFNHLTVLLALHAALQNRMALSMFSLSLGTHLAVYPILLAPSCISILSEKQHTRSTLSTSLKSLAYLLGHLLSLASYTPTSVFLSQVDVNRHLRPNVGLHWYFSIEMFDHFRRFFNLVFQIHLVIYVLPLLIKFKHDRVFAFVLLSGIIATFKSYPSLGDTSFACSLLLLLYPELIAHLRHPLLTVSLYVYALCLLPAFYHLWTTLGSGNANFYYASTLVWATANGLFWIDVLWAHLSRHFCIVELGVTQIDSRVVALVQV